MSEHERRQFPRYLVPPNYRVQMRTESETLVCRVINVSKRGVYVESARRLEMGEALEVELVEEKTSTSIWFSAKVRRVEWTWDPENNVPTVGLGIELIPNEPAESDFLARLVRAAQLRGPCEKTVLLSVEGRQQVSRGFAGYRALIEHQEDEAREDRRLFVAGSAPPRETQESDELPSEETSGTESAKPA